MARQRLMASDAGLAVHYTERDGADYRTVVHCYPDANRAYRDPETNFLVVAQQDDTTHQDEVTLGVYPMGGVVTVRRLDVGPATLPNGAGNVLRLAPNLALGVSE